MNINRNVGAYINNNIILNCMIYHLGLDGLPGMKGDKGEIGLQGQIGYPGPKGLRGEKGKYDNKYIYKIFYVIYNIQ